MLFLKNELIRLLGVSIFEIWMSIIAFFLFTLFLALKLEDDITWSWWRVFLPLFAYDGLSAYFVAIVCIRLILDNEKRKAALRTLWNAFILSLLFIYKVLLCQRLQLESIASYSAIHVPVFVLLTMFTIRGCHIVA